MLADIVADCNQLVINTQGLTLYIQNASQSLTAILYQLGEANLPTLYNTIRSINSNTSTIVSTTQLIKTSLDGFHSDVVEYLDYIVEFFGGFTYESFVELLLDVHEQIDNAVNPLSDDNIDDFNGVIDDLQNDTVIGQSATMINTVSQDVSNSLNIAQSNPSSHLYVNTLSSSLGGATIPARTIDIDMSWYGAYRTQCFSIVRTFVLVSWIIMFVRNLPTLLGGVAPIINSNIDTTNLDIDNSTVVSNPIDIGNVQTSQEYIHLLRQRR